MKEMIRRTVRTFFQSAAGYIIANTAYLITAANTDDYNYLLNSIIGIGVSAIAAGLAAIMNLPKNEDKG